MDFFNKPARIIVSCPNRLSPYLRMETESLGFSVNRQFLTGIELEGTVNDCIRLNLHLRCASQVLYTLFDFTAHHPDDVYNQLTGYPWEKIIPEDAYFSVTSNVQHPTINNSMFVNLRVKDAIADRIRTVRNTRPHSGSSLDGVVIHLFWKNEQASVFIDSSGESLGRHGYRKIPGKAPMLEALAAATIMATRWDRKGPFINPMCGSGTLAIEAALIASKRYPGLYRLNYGFMHLAGYQDDVYKQELKRLQDNISDHELPIIIASDISAEAIRNAKSNAEAAGVHKLIRFEKSDFASTTIPAEQNGILFMNPEYGERLGDLNALEATYARIGDFLKQKCKGYTAYIFTGNQALAKKIRLHPKRKIEFYNAKIDCRLLEYELYEGTRRKVEGVES